MRLLDLKKLHHAVILEKELSFLRASEQLYITQSALTRSIQSLEAELGLKLFVRENSGVKPTPEGKLILAKARHLLLQSGNVRREVENIRLAECGSVNVGVGPAMAGVILPDLFKTLASHHSRVSLTALIESTDKLMSSLLDEEIEFFVGRIEFVPATQGIIDVSVQPLCQVSSGIYVRAGHPLAARRNIGFQELQQFPILLPNVGQDRLRLLYTALGGSFDIDNIKHIMCDSFEILKFAALNSDGVLIALKETVAHELAEGSICELDILTEVSSPTLQFSLVTIEGRSLSFAGQLVLDLIRDVLDSKTG